MNLNKNRMRSLYPNYLLLLCIVFFYSCKNNTDSASSSSETNNTLVEREALNTFNELLKSLPDYSEAFSAEKLKDYIYEDEEGVYINKNKLETNPEIQSVLTETKTGHDDDNWMYTISGKEYLPLYKVVQGETILIGSFVEYKAEGTTPGVSFQLHTFDTKGNQIDYLIVFNQLNFQMILKSNFEATSNFSEITVTSIEEEWLSIDENGKVVGEFPDPEVSKTSKTYNLTEAGTFLEK